MYEYRIKEFKKLTRGYQVSFTVSDGKLFAIRGKLRSRVCADFPSHTLNELKIPYATWEDIEETTNQFRKAKFYADQGIEPAKRQMYYFRKKLKRQLDGIILDD